MQRTGFQGGVAVSGKIVSLETDFSLLITLATIVSSMLKITGWYTLQESGSCMNTYIYMLYWMEHVTKINTIIC